MIKYSFELRKDKVTKDGLMPIRILFRLDGTVIKRNTKYSCKEVDWLKNRVKPKSKNGLDYGQDLINDELVSGQLTPKSGGQFKPNLGGQFKLKLGGQYHRSLQLNKQRI